MIDSLESRRLFAAGVTITYQAGGVMRIDGTSGADKIEFARYGKTQAVVYVDDVLTTRINLGKTVKSVTFSGGDGNDIFIMGRVPLPCTVDGGDGNDAISANAYDSFNDRLYGNSGNDYLYGGPGKDFIDGGGGDDGMIGGGGNDYIKILSDSAGDDTVNGGTGYDTIDCTNYNRGVHLRIGDKSPPVLTVDDFVRDDVEKVLGTGYDDNIANVSGKPITVNLGFGNDIYTGGKAPETIFGGAGNDEIATYGGNDVINDTLGSNIINGGTGTDTFKGKASDALTDIEVKNFV